MFYIIHQPLNNVYCIAECDFDKNFLYYNVFNNSTYTSVLLFMIADTQVHYVNNKLT